MAVEEERVAAFNSYATDSLEEAHDAIAAHYYDLRLEVVGRATEFERICSIVATLSIVAPGSSSLMMRRIPGMIAVGVPLVRTA